MTEIITVFLSRTKLIYVCPDNQRPLNKLSNSQLH